MLEALEVLEEAVKGIHQCLLCIIMMVKFVDPENFKNEIKLIRSFGQLMREQDSFMFAIMIIQRPRNILWCFIHILLPGNLSGLKSLSIQLVL